MDDRKATSCKHIDAQVAAIAGVHPNTVRLYEKLGLIPPAKRRANGYRIYTEEDIRALKIILMLEQMEAEQQS